MKLTQSHIELLKQVRAHIAMERTDYICVALLMVELEEDEHWITICEADALRKAVQEAIGGEETLRQWLLKQGVPDSQLTRTALRKHRLGWLNRMIERKEI